jgi:hypothetical protein
MIMRRSDRFAVLANPTLHPAMTTPDRSSAQGMQVNHLEVLCNAKIHNALKSSAIFGMGGSNCWNWKRLLTIQNRPTAMDFR